MNFSPSLAPEEQQFIEDIRSSITDDSKRRAFNEAIDSLLGMLNTYVKPESNKKNVAGLLQGVSAKLVAAITGSALGKEIKKADRDNAELQAREIIEVYKAYADDMYLANVRALIPNDKPDMLSAFDESIKMIQDSPVTNKMNQDSSFQARQAVEIVMKELGLDRAATIAESVAIVARQIADTCTRHVDKPTAVAKG